MIKAYMDEYRSISWRTRDLSQLEVYLQKDFITDEVLSESLIYKHCQNQCLENTNTTNNDTSNSDSELENLFKDDPYIPGEMEYIDTNRKSRLGQQYQTQCVMAFKLLRSGKNPSAFTFVEKSSIDCLKVNSEKIAEERKEYANFVQNQWLNVDRHRVNFPACLHNYSKLLCVNKMSKITMYPQYYREISLFNLTDNAIDNSIDFIYSGNVLKLGIARRFTPPTLLGKCYLKATANLPSIVDTKQFFSSLPVSQDTNIDKIIQNCNIDIVMSASSLKCLVDTSDLKNSKWVIPVTVKNVEIKNSTGIHIKKIVYLDKPFSMYNPSTVDFNHMCYKRIIKKIFCHTEIQRYATNDQISTDQVNHDNHDEVNYDVWNVKKIGSQLTLMKNRSKTIELNVLIRSKLIASEQIENNRYLPVIIRPKLELQLAYGANIATKSDLYKEWASLFFTPYSNLYRMRLLPQTGELIAVEKRSIENVVSEAHTNYGDGKLNLCLAVLQRVFEELHALEPGKYLLQHLPKHEVFVSILRQCEFDESKTDIFDFGADYRNNPINIDTMIKKLLPTAWVPIDVKFHLPTFDYYNRIPGMFSPHEDIKRHPVKKKRNRKRKILSGNLSNKKVN